MLRQEQFTSLLTPIIYHHFDLSETRVPTLKERLFNVQQSSLAEEKGTGMGGFSTDTWDAWNQTGKKGQLDMDELYTQSYVHKEYPVELVIEKRLLLNDQYGKVSQKVGRARMSADTKMEHDAATFFNNAFDTNYPLSDGKPLCSTTHPKSPNKSSGTFSNSGTLALNASNISTVRTSMMRFTDDKGELIGVMPNVLLVPPEKEDAAIKAVGGPSAPLDPDSANNAANPQVNRWTIIPWMRLTDTNAWFMIDDMWRSEVVNWYNREAIQIMVVRETTTEIVYELKLHYSYGADDWRWIYGNDPS